MVSSSALTALTEQLGSLSAVLGDPGTDLRTILEVLVDDLSVAVSSFLGLTMTLHSGWFPVTMTAIGPDAVRAARSCVAVPFGRSTGAQPGDTIVLYGSRPGAFVDLAADLQRVHGLDGEVVLDGDLPAPSGRPRDPGVAGLVELSVINQAIGVLITPGNPPDQARAELRRRAAMCQTSVTEAARQVLATTNSRRRARSRREPACRTNSDDSHIR